MKKTLCFVTVFLLVLVTSHAYAAGFTNGNFETGNFTGWTLGGNTGDSAIVTGANDSNTTGINPPLYKVANGTYGG